MKKLLDGFLTIYFWTISILALLITFIICCFLYFFVDQKTFSRIYESIPGYIVLYSMLIPGFWSLKVIDLRSDKTWNHKRYIIIANHLSMVDSLVSVVLPLKKKFMIGKIFTHIPIFGWLSRMSGHIPVSREEPNKLQFLEKSGVYRAAKNMEDGCSFMIFPEGKRNSNPKELLEFKSGAFYLSLATQVPILPIVIKGTDQALPIGGITSSASIEMIIGEPFYVTDVQEAISKSREFIYSHL